MMFKVKALKHIIIYSVVLLMFNCSSEIDYSPIPSIEFQEIKVLKKYNGGDSLLKIIIYYIDGDGDLGLDQEDTIAPYDSIYYYNLFIRYFETINDEFKEVVSPFTNDTIRFYYRFPVLTPSSKNKTIKGTIEFPIADLTSLFEIHNPIKFRIHIVDRALNESNKVESPIFNFYP